VVRVRLFLGACVPEPCLQGRVSALSPLSATVKRGFDGVMRSRGLRLWERSQRSFYVAVRSDTYVRQRMTY
jgi:hypothetical protein